MLITVNLQSRNIRSEKIDRHWSTTKVKNLWKLRWIEPLVSNYVSNELQIFLANVRANENVKYFRLNFVKSQ